MYEFVANREPKVLLVVKYQISNCTLKFRVILGHKSWGWWNVQNCISSSHHNGSKSNTHTQLFFCVAFVHKHKQQINTTDQNLIPASQHVSSCHKQSSHQITSDTHFVTIVNADWWWRNVFVCVCACLSYQTDCVCVCVIASKVNDSYCYCYSNATGDINKSPKMIWEREMFTGWRVRLHTKLNEMRRVENCVWVSPVHCVNSPLKVSEFSQSRRGITHNKQFPLSLPLSQAAGRKLLVGAH